MNIQGDLLHEYNSEPDVSCGSCSGLAKNMELHLDHSIASIRKSFEVKSNKDKMPSKRKIR